MDFWASSTNDTRDTLMVNGFVDYYKPPPQRDNNQQPNITRKKRINIRPINLMVGYLKAKQELDREYTTKLQSIAMKMEKTIPLCDESHEGLRECMHGYASLQRTLSENHREKMELADADIQQLEMLRGEIVTTYTEGRAKITQLKEQYSTQKATTLSINKANQAISREFMVAEANFKKALTQVPRVESTLKALNETMTSINVRQEATIKRLGESKRKMKKLHVEYKERQHSTQSELALLENKRVESIAGSIARGLELESDHCSVWQLKTASVSVLLNVNTDGVYSSSSVFNSVENSSAYTSMDNSDANDASDDDIADAIVVDRKQPLSSDGVCGEEISARTGISASLSSSAQSSSLSSASPSPSSPSSAVDTTLAATTPTSRAAPQFSHSYDVNVYSVNEPHGQNDDSKVKKNDEPHVSDDQHRRIGENENKTDKSNNDHADESRYNENKDRNNGNHAHDDKG